MNHDIIAIGASAGSLDVLLAMCSNLPADIPASLFVAVHSARGYTSSLPELMSERGRVPASHPLHGEKIEVGHIYIAPPDNHLYVRQGLMEIVRGPKENGHRPSVDALFRTASVSYGPRVVGVVLSGYQDCGTAGMMSIKARGGVGIVQDPDTALIREMPQSVIDYVDVDHIVTPVELPDLLVRLAGSPAKAATNGVSGQIEMLEGTKLGEAVELVCPLCQGVLTEIHPGAFQHFRCHVGHSFTLKSLVAEQSEELERALWAAVRALDESAALSKRLYATEKGQLKETFAERAKTQSEQAEIIRHILLHGARLTKEDAAKV